MTKNKVESQEKWLTIDMIPITVTVPKQYEVEIKGIGGLLMNKAPDLSQPKVKKQNQAKVDLSEQERSTWREKLYYDAGDQVYIPGENLHECLQDGCKYWGQRIQGEGKKTYTDLVKSGCVVESLYLELNKNDDKRIIAFGKNVNGTPRPGQKGGPKIYRIRPLLPEWGGKFRMHVFDDRLIPDVLKAIISFAGTFKGVCDWRPTYGRFRLISIREV